MIDELIYASTKMRIVIGTLGGQHQISHLSVSYLCPRVNLNLNYHIMYFSCSEYILLQHEMSINVLNINEEKYLLHWYHQSYAGCQRWTVEPFERLNDSSSVATSYPTFPGLKSAIKTEEYKKVFEDLRKEGRSPEFIDSFLRSFVIEYTSKILVD